DRAAARHRAGPGALPAAAGSRPGARRPGRLGHRARPERPAGRRDRVPRAGARRVREPAGHRAELRRAPRSRVDAAAAPGTDPHRGANEELRRRPAEYQAAHIAASAGIGAWLYGRLAFENTPNLVGLTQSQATNTLANDGLKYTIATTYSDKVAVGDVVSVSPSPGTPVKQGAVITLTVSKGQQDITVPNVSGQNQDDATNALKQRGFTVAVATDQASSGTVPKGSVVSYTPKGSAPAGSTITLTISSGPKQVVVRDVTGMTVEDATAALEAQGFSVQTTRLLPFVDSVGRQSPGGGSSVDYGST